MKPGKPLGRKTGLARGDSQLSRSTSLTAHTDLSRSPSLPRAPFRAGRGGGETPQQARRKVQLATWADVLEVMYPRDGYRCAGCGTPDGLSGHHRELKQMGSTKTLDLVENALTLCQWRCHPYAHRWRNSKAIALGWCVPQGGDHTEFPVTYADGSRWLLLPDGDRAPYGGAS